EERMLALQARKAALADGILGSDAAGAVKFSAEDMEGLLAPLEAITPTLLPPADRGKAIGGSRRAPE
ncbi:MAG TPA: hypothetical protein VNQ74_07170, partial [Burkholderiaceae bacterium]|nr:hypothetical protein [Burkholderiaceae bacterium]